MTQTSTNVPRWLEPISGVKTERLASTRTAALGNEMIRMTYLGHASLRHLLEGPIDLNLPQGF